jgi:hypothetical protein
MPLKMSLNYSSRGLTQKKAYDRYFSLFQNVQTVSGAHPAICSIYTGILSLGQSFLNVKLTIYLHLAPRLKISGSISLLPLYA